MQTYQNQIIQGDCIEVMKKLPTESVDLIVTDPPYLVNYTSRDGRAYPNDNPAKTQWIEPAFAEAYRVLKKDTFCVCFYGWHKVNYFLYAWRKAGFRTLEQLIWVKDYPASTGKVQRYHEAAYLMEKGNSPRPQVILRSVLPWQYEGNELHPTQKPVMTILPLIMAYSRPGDLVLDPFCGSGTTAVAARQLGRRFIGIEISEEYARIAQERLNRRFPSLTKSNS